MQVVIYDMTIKVDRAVTLISCLIYVVIVLKRRYFSVDHDHLNVTDEHIFRFNNVNVSTDF